MTTRIGLLLAGLLALMSAQAIAAQPAQWVRVTTSMGDFVIEVNAERAPLTAANFLRYVKEGYYAGTLFHRVVSNFVVQGGGYMAADFKLKTPHESIPNEAGNGLRNKRGTVGLARAGEPHSGNAQFYVNLADNPDLDPVPTRWGYAVFGSVVQGMEVLERIGVLPTGKAGPFKSEAPLTPVVIQKAELLSVPPALEAKPPGAPEPPPTLPSPPPAE
jgi:cyclophilin family peptidyl-prolyl cis-trans isomerase